MNRLVNKQQNKMLDVLREQLVSTYQDPAVARWKQRKGELENRRHRGAKSRRLSNQTTFSCDSDFPVFWDEDTPRDETAASMESNQGYQRRLQLRKPRANKRDKSFPAGDDRETSNLTLTESLPDLRRLGLTDKRTLTDDSMSSSEDLYIQRRNSIRNTFDKLNGREKPRLKRLRTGSGDELMLMSLPGRKGSLNNRNIRRLSIKRESVPQARNSMGSSLDPITETTAMHVDSGGSALDSPGRGQAPSRPSRGPSQNMEPLSEGSWEVPSPQATSRQDTTPSSLGQPALNPTETTRMKLTRKWRSTNSRMIPAALTGSIKGYGKFKSMKKKLSNRRLSRTPSIDDTPSALGFGNKFRRLCKFICVLYRLWKVHSTRVQDILQSFESLDALVEIDDANKEQLLFDMSDYKAHREARISQEARRILQMPPHTRSESELYYLRIALRNYPSMVEYPVHMQKLIAERAWYEGYNPKRIIIREGHPPMNFYFILSGAVIVSVFDKKKNINKTVCFLNRGDSFGEVSLMNRTRRETTVISKEKLELLCLSEQDFYDIFMSGGLNNPKDPFLRSIPYLKGWPLKLLGCNPKKAMFSFFKRDTILVKDSNNSDWLYIVKSGSCCVLKKLKFVAPELFKGSKKKVLKKIEEPDKYLSHEDRLQKKMLVELEKMENTSSWQKQMNRTEINIATLPSYISTVWNDKDHNLNEKIVPLVKEQSQSHILVHREKSIHLQASVPFLSTPSVPKIVVNDDNQEEQTESKGALKDALNLITEDTAVKDKKGAKAQEDTPEKEADMFVVVQTLTKGSVFGLADVVYGHQPDQPSLIVVSNGAEIILINKKFYSEHMDQFLETKLREDIYPFPTDDILQEQLRTTVNWEYNRRQALVNTLNRLKFEKADVHDARSTLSVHLNSYQ